MESTNPILPPDIEAAVEANHGGPVAVPGQHGRYVIMNADLYGGVHAVRHGARRPLRSDELPGQS